MRPRLALGLAIASLPPAYAEFVDLWQLVSFTGFAVRVGDEALPGEVWAQTALLVATSVAIPVALFVAWRAASRDRLRPTLVALGVAWIAAAPLFVSLFRGF